MSETDPIEFDVHGLAGVRVLGKARTWPCFVGALRQMDSTVPEPVMSRRTYHAGSA